MLTCHKHFTALAAGISFLLFLSLSAAPALAIDIEPGDGDLIFKVSNVNIFWEDETEPTSVELYDQTMDFRYDYYQVHWRYGMTFNSLDEVNMTVYEWNPGVDVLIHFVATAADKNLSVVFTGMEPWQTFQKIESGQPVVLVHANADGELEYTNTNVTSEDVTLVGTGWTPYITSTPSMIVNQFAKYRYQLTTSDSTARVDVEDCPSWLFYNADTQVLEGIPQYMGQYNVRLNIENEYGESWQNWTITVVGQNVPIYGNFGDIIPLAPSMSLLLLIIVGVGGFVLIIFFMFRRR